jgi:AcrR family transcriptional regulator
MERKEIQEQRMRSYFIDATKQILKSEGLRCVNVRAIAEKAGYSYATLYNYFKDVKELVFECVRDFQDECAAFVETSIPAGSAGTERIKAAVKAYMKFFVQYPGVFDLFFLERMSELQSRKPTSELIRTFLDRICGEEWRKGAREGWWTEKQAMETMEELNAAVTGMLLYYMNRGCPETYGEFTALSERMLERILGRHTEARFEK